MKTLRLGGVKVLVDSDDVEWIKQHAWRVQNTPQGMTYIRSHKKVGREFKDWALHRAIMEHALGDSAIRGKLIDHKNGNTLDNRKQNLRVCDYLGSNANRRSKNLANQTRGVSRSTCGPNWQATIKVNRKSIYLGMFPTPELAARAYDDAARRLHGEFARLNFP
jgi:hypothetical protein